MTAQPTVLKEGTAPSVLFVDPFSTKGCHLFDDDFFLTECIKPLTQEYLAATPPESAANLRRRLQVNTWDIPPVDPKARSDRPRLFRLVLSLSAVPFQDIIFQSFEEVSVLLFMLRNPFKRVHLIVTNNLRPDRLKRNPVLGRFFLRAVFQRAASVIVHSQHEVEKVREITPRINPDRIFIKPFHQISASRLRIPLDQKRRMVLFLGPESPHKRVAPIVDLIKMDHGRQYQYLFFAMNGNTAAETEAFLQSRENVELRFGYIPADEYYRLFSEAALILMTHDKDYEGTLSGAFCDAIASGTPVVAQDMAPHNEFFAAFGPMGFLVDYADPDWFEPLLATDLSARYQEFQKNMIACRDSCNMEAIRNVFRSALMLS